MLSPAFPVAAWTGFPWAAGEWHSLWNTKSGARRWPNACLTTRVKAKTGDSDAALHAGVERRICRKMLNYTPWYIHTAEIQGPEGSGVHGGGPNVMPVQENGRPSGGGKATCCLTYPTVWQPDLRLTVRWLAVKGDYKKIETPANWYKAENVRIAHYDTNKTAGAWLIFLPDDRVRLMIVDGNEGGNDPDKRPPDDDPLIVKGVVDTEWNERFPNGVARGLQQ